MPVTKKNKKKSCMNNKISKLGLQKGSGKNFYGKTEYDNFDKISNNCRSKISRAYVKNNLRIINFPMNYIASVLCNSKYCF